MPMRTEQTIRVIAQIPAVAHSLSASRFVRFWSSSVSVSMVGTVRCCGVSAPVAGHFWLLFWFCRCGGPAVRVWCVCSDPRELRHRGNSRASVRYAGTDISGPLVLQALSSGFGPGGLATTSDQDGCRHPWRGFTFLKGTPHTFHILKGGISHFRWWPSTVGRGTASEQGRMERTGRTPRRFRCWHSGVPTWGRLHRYSAN